MMTKKIKEELKCSSSQYSHLGFLAGTKMWEDFVKNHKRQPTIIEADGVSSKRGLK